jgi:hypothetical protein
VECLHLCATIDQRDSCSREQARSSTAHSKSRAWLVRANILANGMALLSGLGRTADRRASHTLYESRAAAVQPRPLWGAGRSILPAPPAECAVPPWGEGGS